MSIGDYSERRERTRILALLHDHPEWKSLEAMSAINRGKHYDEKYMKLGNICIECGDVVTREGCACKKK